MIVPMNDDMAARAVREMFKFTLYGSQAVKLLALTSTSLPHGLRIDDS